MLEIKGLTKYYRNVAVVDDVSFNVRPGEVTGYLGPNGSGKSTTVKMIVTLLQPSRGHVLLEGRDIRDHLAAFKQRLGYVPEEPVLYSYMTGLEYLQLMGRLRRLPESLVEHKANELLELFSLHSYRHAPISTYSKGMKQRVLISAALLHNPDVLILDEPLFRHRRHLRPTLPAPAQRTGLPGQDHSLHLPRAGGSRKGLRPSRDHL